MYILSNEISKTDPGDFHRSLRSTIPGGFMLFGNNRCKRGRDPMEIPNNHLTTICVDINLNREKMNLVLK